MINCIRRALMHHSIVDVDVNSAELLHLHRFSVQTKFLLREAFNSFYLQINDILIANRVEGERVLELGSGAGFAAAVIPNLIASDIRFAPNLDLMGDACNFPVSTHSFGAVFAINVFHHINSPELFLDECIRIVRPGGLVVLVEPHIGLLSSLFHRMIHTNEYFDETTVGWSNEAAHGPMLGANQALAHNIFVRDNLIFNKKYDSRLFIDNSEYSSNTLTYLLSGGVNFIQLAPDSTSAILSSLSNFIFKNSLLSLHKFTILRTTSNNRADI